MKLQPIVSHDIYIYICPYVCIANHVQMYPYIAALSIVIALVEQENKSSGMEVIR